MKVCLTHLTSNATMNTLASFLLLVNAALAVNLEGLDYADVQSARTSDGFFYSIQQHRLQPLVYDGTEAIEKRQFIVKDNNKDVKNIDEGILYIYGQPVDLKKAQQFKPIIVKGSQPIKQIQKPGSIYPFYPTGILLKQGLQGKEEELVFLTYPSNMIPIGQPPSGVNGVYINPSKYPNYASGYPYKNNLWQQANVHPLPPSNIWSLAR